MFKVDIYFLISYPDSEVHSLENEHPLVFLVNAL